MSQRGGGSHYKNATTYRRDIVYANDLTKVLTDPWGKLSVENVCQVHPSLYARQISETSVRYKRSTREGYKEWKEWGIASVNDEASLE